TFSAGAVYIDPDVNISGTSPSRRTLDADNIAPTAWVPNVHFVMENEARRFIALVDEFYERHVKLVVSAAAPLYEIYQGERLKFE
ncbi:AFG1/ZapE family ATPase, partial [Salmonella enterica subsp. enterica serovar Virginia]|nr:AFG1/ZapE family ATPase [Salmonella enterica subsp. enterica serovar Virginia]